LQAQVRNISKELPNQRNQ